MYLSVITVVYNDVFGLSKTIKSVNSFAKNSSHDIEFIVVDGASNDGSESSQNLIDEDSFIRTIFISEADFGIYDAMNKGINHLSSNSDYCLFMNAGDFFVETAAALLENHNFTSEVEVFCVNSELDGKEINVRRAINRYCIENWPAYPHQATFISSTLQRDAHYNLDYKILADYDFFSKVYSLGVSISMNSGTVSTFSQGGASNRINTYLKMMREMISIQKCYFDKVNYKLIFSMGIKVLLRCFPFNSSLERMVRTMFFGVKK